MLRLGFLPIAFEDCEGLPARVRLLPAPRGDVERTDNAGEELVWSELGAKVLEVERA